MGYWYWNIHILNTWLSQKYALMCSVFMPFFIFVSAMTTLGVKDFLVSPEGAEENKINYDTFLTEAWVFEIVILFTLSSLMAILKVLHSELFYIKQPLCKSK